MVKRPYIRSILASNLASSAVKRAEYDRRSNTLSLWFPHSASPYVYFEVPERVYAGLLRANSAGRYFNAVIRDRYHYSRCRAAALQGS